MSDNFRAVIVGSQPANSQQTPQAEGPQTASLFERVIAFLLDFSMLFTLFFWALAATARYAGWEPTTGQMSAAGVAFWALFILYNAFFGSNGRRTIGKLLLGIAVADKDTLAPLPFGRALLRALGYIVGIMTAFTGFALAALNIRRRAVQDFMGRSVVLSTRAKTAGETALISAFGTVLIGLSVFYMYYVLMVMPAAYQKNLVDNATAQLAAIAYLQLEHKDLFGAYTPDITRLGLISGDAVQFQRDIQKTLKRRGFSMGVGAHGFSLRAIAKDIKQTEVTYEFTE